VLCVRLRRHREWKWGRVGVEYGFYVFKAKKYKEREDNVVANVEEGGCGGIWQDIGLHKVPRSRGKCQGRSRGRRVGFV
jgi:hypothetical protein